MFRADIFTISLKVALSQVFSFKLHIITYLLVYIKEFWNLSLFLGPSNHDNTQTNFCRMPLIYTLCWRLYFFVVRHIFNSHRKYIFKKKTWIQHKGSYQLDSCSKRVMGREIFWIQSKKIQSVGRNLLFWKIWIKVCTLKEVLRVV